MTLKTRTFRTRTLMLSVIIPTLNESDSIAHILEDLRLQKDVSLEIIVADGGSADDTLQRIEAFRASHPCLSITDLTTAPGRGHQMNRGADRARGDHLFFLHADCRLSHDDQLREALDVLQAVEVETGNRVAGHFTLEFETTRTDLAELLGYYEKKSGLNREGTFNGDQGLLISRSLFRLLGGFSEALPFMEDQELGERLRTFGSFITLPGKLKTSARRFEKEGSGERIVLNAIIMAMFSLRLMNFFNRAPGVYRHQGNARRLQLLPFFRLATDAICDAGVWMAIRRVFAIGRYITLNAWQIALWLEHQYARDYLTIYDRYIDRLIRNPLGYLLGTLLFVIWYASMRIRLQLA